MIMAFAGQLLVSFSALAGDAYPINVGGGLQLTPVIKLGFSHEDNIFHRQAHPKSSYITNINPSFKLQAGRGPSTLSLTYSLDKMIFHESRVDDALKHLLVLKADKEFTRRLRGSFLASYNQNQNRRGTLYYGLKALVKSPYKYRQSKLHASVSYGLRRRLKLSAQYMRRRYENNRYLTITRDRDTMGADLSFSSFIAPKTFAVLEARYMRYDYLLKTALINLNSVQQTYMVGLDWAATAKTSGSLRVGYQTKHFSRSTNTASRGLYESLSMRWSPRTYSTISLKTGYGLRETNGMGTFIRNKHVSLSWKHQWTSRLRHTVSASYALNQYFGSNAYYGTAGLIRGGVYATTAARLRVDYRFLRWLSTGVGYSYLQRSSNIQRVNYRENIFSINLQAVL